MRWIVYAAIASSLAGGAVWTSSRAQEEEPEVEEFVPTEKVPADSSISFPVDI